MSHFYILSTGTELSSGRSRDSNGPRIAQRLEEEGFKCGGISLLPDDARILKEHIRNLIKSEIISLIIITGGLGPTSDDLTIDVLSDICSKDIIEDRGHLEKLQLFIHTKARKIQFDIARRQVRVLDTSYILKNDTGLAPGMLLELGTESKKKWIAAMPGYPQEMNPMLENYLLPELKKLIPAQTVFRKDFYLYGISESAFQRQFIESISLSTNFSWGVAARNAHLKIFIESSDETEILETYKKASEFYAESILELPVIEMLHNILLEKKITIGGAESCTGGLIGKILTDIPGSSNYFKGCIVSYSNDVKKTVLGVREKTLEMHGAVSEECAVEMAEGARNILNTDYSFSVTGVAGPEGGTEKKPVGTAWTAFNDGKNILTRKFFFPVDRDRMRMNTAHIVLFHLYRMILEKV